MYLSCELYENANTLKIVLEFAVLGLAKRLTIPGKVSLEAEIHN